MFALAVPIARALGTANIEVSRKPYAFGRCR